MPRRRVGNTAGRFGAALLIACLVHLILLRGMDFTLPQVGSGTRAAPPLEIMVLPRARPVDEKPGVIAVSDQVDRIVRNGETAPEADAESGTERLPEIPEFDPKPTLPGLPLIPLLPMLPGPTRPGSVATEQPLALVLPAGHKPEPESELQLPAAPFLASEPPRVKAAEIQASRNRELTELTTRIQHAVAASANRSRRKAIGAGMHEYKYANYLEAWQRKVERVGNLNYPEEAKRRRIYGDLVLHIAIRVDGRLEQVRVLRSSGFDLLDEAAVGIVELAAPFSPFPPAIRAETDVLDITRTWRFLSRHRFDGIITRPLHIKHYPN